MSPLLVCINRFSWLCFLTFLLSCGTGHDETGGDGPSALYAPPDTAFLDTLHEYAVNPFTHKPGKIFVNSVGDTIPTGVSMAAKGRIIPSEMLKPKIYPASPSAQPPRPADPAYKSLASSGTVFHLPDASLKRRSLGDGNQEAVLKNKIGDTIPSGIPLSIKGKVVPAVLTKPVLARPAATREEAMHDLRYLGVDQGLQSSYIMSLCEDSRGNIWLGSQEAGITRYDGTYFTRFTTKEGLSLDRVWEILEDRNGRMWFATDGNGVNMYDGHSFTHFTEKEGLPAGMIKCMMEDSKGNLWLGSGGGGVSLLKDTTIIHYGLKEGIPAVSVISMCEDRKGRIWFGTFGGGVCRFDGETFTYLTSAEGLPANTVWKIIEDKDGVIWFATEHGLARYDEKTLVRYRSEDGLGSDFLFDLAVDPDGRIWYASYGSGLGMFDGRGFTHFDKTNGLTSDIVWSLMLDSRDQLWIGTIAGGANILRLDGFDHFNEHRGLPGAIVHEIFEDSRGRIWIGNDQGGASWFDGTTFHTLTDYAWFNDQAIMAVGEDKANNIWFGLYGQGICRYDGKSMIHYGLDSGLPVIGINTFYTDPQGRVWMGGDDGIVIYDGQQFIHYSDTSGLASKVVYSITADPDGNIWIGSSGGGITRFDGSHFLHLTTREGLPSDMTWQAWPDHAGRLWVATDDQGIYRLNGSQIIRYAEPQGLPALVQSIVEAPDHSIWAGTIDGLVHLVPDTTGRDIADSDLAFRVEQLTKPDGLRSSDFFENSILVDRHGRAWFGGSQALERLDLARRRPGRKPKPPALQSVEVGQHFIDFHHVPDSLRLGLAFDSVTPYVNYPLDPVIPYRSNHLTFLFSSADPKVPHHLRYSFRMASADESWSEPSPETKADYRNIGMGDHTFEVRTVGQDGQWSEATRYDFTVRPPWWQTWWARAGYLVLALLGMAGMVRWRTAALKARAVRLQEEVDKATVVIREQKEQVEVEKQRSEDLLLNILPAEVAEELKEKGTADARHFDDVSVLFTDFKGFTEASEKLSPTELVSEIDVYFRAFDEIVHRYGVEKIKTIGDSYMAAGGLPVPNTTNALDVIRAALDIRDFTRQHAENRHALGKSAFEVRIGVHTGPVVAGIVGIKKFQYDIWGDTVNMASRMESTGEPGHVHVSSATHALLRDQPGLRFISRGWIQVKGKGEVETFYVDREAG